MIIVSDKIQQLPKHFTVEFFQKVLENGLKIPQNSNLKLENIKIEAGSASGENYCSQIFRAIIEYKIVDNERLKEQSKISLIVKYTEAINSTRFQKFFYKELQMYKEVIPEMEKILQSSLAPKFFYSIDAPYYTIVLEDLQESGYQIEDRIKGLSEEQAINVIRKLAEYHAASMVVVALKPEIKEYFHESIFHPNDSSDPIRNEIKTSFLTGNLPLIVNLLRTKLKSYESIAPKIEKMSNNFIEKCLKVLTQNGISVLNHGDLWVNNIMLKNGSKSMDIKFIDFPIAYWGTLGMDLHYFLNTSVQINILKLKRYDLLRNYYSKLKETLEKLNYDKIPTWDDVKNSVLQTELYGFCVIQAVTPLLSLPRDASKDSSFDMFLDKKKMERHFELSFGNEVILEKFIFQLNRLDELGIFDQEFLL